MNSVEIYLTEHLGYRVERNEGIVSRFIIPMIEEEKINKVKANKSIFLKNERYYRSLINVAEIENKVRMLEK